MEQSKKELEDDFKLKFGDVITYGYDKDIFDFFFKIIESERNEWISVEERLPELGQEILVIDSDNTVVTDVHYFEDGFNLHPYGYYNDRRLLTGITHWQPLPTPPQPKSK